MGAVFCNLTFDGSLSRAELTDKFDDAVAQSLYENGHSYSGDIGMATGLTILTRTFETYDEAREWVSDHAEKWGPALAVRYSDNGQEFWFVGATCSS